MVIGIHHKMRKFFVHPDISIAETLPAEFYRSQEIFEVLKEKIFVKSWHWIGTEKELLPKELCTYPFELLKDYLCEPLILVRTEKELKCLTNVCTHRGHLVVLEPSKNKKLSCLYHGRKFELDGTFSFMPEFKEVKNFPRPCDSLKEFSLANFRNHLFVSLSPNFDFNHILSQMKQRIGHLPIDEFICDTSRNKSYFIDCHWALYCDNYLEGFHIPFVHDSLNEVLDYGNYTTEIYDYFNLQIGYSDGSDEVFDFPEGHIDYGKKVSAYYYWIFPNMMFNFYPWGLSINIVEPLSLNKTKVSFISYVHDSSKLNKGAGAGLDKVEQEDEAVVEAVNKGLKSRFYTTGRFSPTKEKGVHHFHQLLTHYLNAENENDIRA